MKTAHSEYGKLKRLIMKRPRDAFRNESFLESQWKTHHYLSKPDFEAACMEYEYFEDLVARNGAQIDFLFDSEEVSIDSVYCRDAALVTDFGVILCSMGKEVRRNEPREEEKLLAEIGLEIRGRIDYTGTLEGGDVAWLDPKTLAVGHGYRTNLEGIAQLKALLRPKGVEIIVVDLPHYRGPADVFHLMSILSPVDSHKAVVYSPLMPVRFRNILLEKQFDLIEVPNEEFDSMGCNVLAISPSECIAVKGNPQTAERLIENGCRVHLYDGEEISVKGGGGPTCLTRPILREI
jgi:N-dimethylarginine dimethylaminohydrolase